ncbi:hypothetical protein ST45_02860, partial [Prevotella pectinovora]
WIEPAGLAAGAGRQQHQAVGARGNRTLGVPDAGNIRQHERPLEELPHRTDEGEWIEPAGLAAGAGRQQHQAVGARGNRTLGVPDAGNIRQHD